MNIAVIGTSPIILMLALKLSSNNNIKIFDTSKNIGGAWSVKKFGNNLYIPRQTNVVVPTSFKEEKKLIKLNEYLKNKYDIKIKKFNNFQFKQAYRPKNIFFYDLSLFYNKVKKKIQVKNKHIKKILIKGKKFYLGNEEFDKVLLPYFSSVNSIEKKKKIFTNYDVSKSKHIVCVMKKKTLKKLIYEENTDIVFDRYLVNGEKNYFVGRVSREYKKKSLKSIIRRTKIKFLDEKNIKIKSTFYYEHFKRDEKQIKILESTNKNENLLIIDTKQFVNSLVKFKNIYE